MMSPSELEAEVIARAMEAVHKLGYSALKEHSINPKRRVFGFGKREPMRVADILVEHGGKSAVIEVKTYTPLLGAVSQMREYGDHFNAQPILCVPDVAFEKIPGSVQEYADRVNVSLCPVSEIGETLKDLLE